MYVILYIEESRWEERNGLSKNARVFKALCDENRWKILDLLKNGEQCGCVLLNKLDISQSTLSHHMKILCDSGIVEGKKQASGPTTPSHSRE